MKSKKAISGTIGEEFMVDNIDGDFTHDFVLKLNKDVKEAIKTMSNQEISYLVRTYYNLQKERIAMNLRAAALGKNEEPHQFYQWIANNMQNLENRIRSALLIYARHTEVGEWLLSICGIGGVIAAGLIARLDVERGKNPSSFIKICGQMPNQKAKKGEKIDYDANLKKLCFIIGESFVKVSGNKKDYYGKIYKEFKEKYTSENEKIAYKDVADECLKRFNKSTQSYKHYEKGMLPPAQIHARARKKAVVIFLHHLWSVMSWCKTQEEPKLPWILMQEGHSRMREIPNKPW